MLPAIFLVLDIMGLVKHHETGGQQVLIWIVFLAIGAGAGALLGRGVQVRADRARWLIGLPGDKRILPLVLVVFAVKYALGYLAASEPALAGSAGFLAVTLGLGGFFTGIFLGRFLSYVAKFFRVAPEQLEAVPVRQ